MHRIRSLRGNDRGGRGNLQGGAGALPQNLRVGWGDAANSPLRRIKTDSFEIVRRLEKNPARRKGKENCERVIFQKESLFFRLKFF